MRSVTLGAVISFLLGVVCSLGCIGPDHGRPQVIYTVGVSQDRAYLDVTMRVSGLPRDGAEIAAHAPPGICQVIGFEVQAPDGRPIRFRQAASVDSSRDGFGDIPRYQLVGPLPSTATVRYRVVAGHREGDAHHGYRGRSFGHLGKQFGLTTGRQVFLFLEPAERTTDIRVRFTLPAGWKPVVPWVSRQDGWDPRIDGQFAAEHLAAAPIGFGHFIERGFTVGKTTYRIALEASAAAQDSERFTAALRSGVEYVTGVFGDRLGPNYLFVAVPKTPEGDEIVAGAWGTGQGGTLYPLTPSRAAQCGSQLIGAYLRHHPYRSALTDPREYWLVDGLENFYGLKAAVAAGLVEPKSILPDLAKRYAQLLDKPNATRALEDIHRGSVPPPALIRQVLAPTVLAFLDHQLGERSSQGLSPSIAKIFRASRARSFWATLVKRDTSVRTFRSRYVRDGLPLPTMRVTALQPTTSGPKLAGHVAGRFTVVLTGKTDGFLENCGCKTAQAGGVARRATVIERLRRVDPKLLLLDAGSAFTRVTGATDLDYLTREEQSIYLQTMSSMRYDAAVIGETELQLGHDYFAAQTAAARLRYLTANVGRASRLIGQPWARLSVANLDVAVLGVFDPLPAASNPVLEDRTEELHVDEPIGAVQRMLASVRGWADLVIVMGNLRPETIRQLIDTCPEIDLVASTDDRAAAGSLATVPSPVERNESPRDRSGFLGHTYVAYTRPARYGLVVLDLGIDSDGRLATVSNKQHYLFAAIPDEPGIRATLAEFYDRVGRRSEAQESVPPLFPRDRARLLGEYVGEARCGTCHVAEHAQWKSTPHATAFRTLLERHRNFQPRCVSCHVVGFGTAHGYRLGQVDESLANVQCEVCHGPGGDHVKEPHVDNIRRKVPESVCVECHDTEHSDRFVYASALPMVAHRSGATGARPDIGVLDVKQDRNGRSIK